MNLSPLDDPFLIHHILLYVDYESILNYCRSHKQAGNICRDHVLWERKALQDFDIPRNVFRNTKLSPALRYLQCLTYKGRVTFGSEIFIHLDKFMKLAIRQDRDDLVQYILGSGFDNYSLILREYASKCNLRHVEHFLKLSPDFNAAAVGALSGNHRQFFDYIRSIAPSNYKWCWDDLIWGAVFSNDEALFNHVEALLPKDYDFTWKDVIYDSVTTGKLKTFEFIRSLILTRTPNYHFRWDFLVSAAAGTGNQGIFDHVRALGLQYSPHPFEDWNEWAFGAIKSKNRQLFNHIRSLAPPGFVWEWDEFAIRALRGGDQQLFDCVRELGPQDLNWNWDKLIIGALFSEDSDLIQYVLKLTPSDYVLDWNEIIAKAMWYKNEQILTLVPANFPLNWNEIISHILRDVVYMIDDGSFDRILSLALTRYPLDWNYLVQQATAFNNTHCLKCILRLVPGSYPLNPIPL